MERRQRHAQAAQARPGQRPHHQDRLRRAGARRQGQRAARGDLRPAQHRLALPDGRAHHRHGLQRLRPGDAAVRVRRRRQRRARDRGGRHALLLRRARQQERADQRAVGQRGRAQRLPEHLQLRRGRQPAGPDRLQRRHHGLERLRLHGQRRRRQARPHQRLHLRRQRPPHQRHQGGRGLRQRGRRPGQRQPGHRLQLRRAGPPDRRDGRAQPGQPHLLRRARAHHGHHAPAGRGHGPADRVQARPVRQRRAAHRLRQRRGGRRRRRGAGPGQPRRPAQPRHRHQLRHQRARHARARRRAVRRPRAVEVDLLFVRRARPHGQAVAQREGRRVRRDDLPDQRLRRAGPAVVRADPGQPGPGRQQHRARHPEGQRLQRLRRGGGDPDLRPGHQHPHHPGPDALRPGRPRLVQQRRRRRRHGHPVRRPGQRDGPDPQHRRRPARVVQTGRRDGRAQRGPATAHRDPVRPARPRGRHHHQRRHPVERAAPAERRLGQDGARLQPERRRQPGRGRPARGPGHRLPGALPSETGRRLDQRERRAHAMDRRLPGVQHGRPGRRRL